MGKSKAFYDRSGKVRPEILEAIRKEYAAVPRLEFRDPLCLVDSVLVGLRQVELLEEIRNRLREEKP
jgi:hypothetical protein